ncbi:MAG: multidrug DMT transporter permease [Candidimonas sp.]|nr:MAG: multidrug DMT transporter permease [Candidimonas sp.]
MPLHLFLLILLAAVLHATWNLVSKRAAAAGASFVFAYRLFSTVLFAPWVAYVLWFDDMTWNLAVVGFILLSSVLHLCYGLCLQRGYQAGDLSVVYPIARGTGPLLATGGAFMLLGEQATASGLIGIACVVGGVLLIATQARWQLFLKPQAWVGVRWGATIGVFIACYTLSDAYSVKVLGIAPVVLDWMAGVGITCMMAPAAWVQRDVVRRKMRGQWKLAFIVGLLSPTAYILVLYALRHGAPVSLAAPLRETSLMVATLAGYFILKEKVGPIRWLGCLVILAGVVALSGH